MEKVLEGVKVVEVSIWAYVPSAGTVLAEWGAEVVKIEPPAGDPIRGLSNAGVGPVEGIVFPWELWNRGKRGLVLDLTRPAAQEILLKLCEEADVLLTSYLPPVRERLGFSEDVVRGRNPEIIYACGTGQGYQGDEASGPGYDFMTYWSRGGPSAAVSPPDYSRVLGMPAGAFGDSSSGMILAGGIAAALVRKARTGKGGTVHGSLLGSAAWAMQMNTVGAYVARVGAGAAATTDDDPGPAAMPPIPPMANPLVIAYKTSDSRWIVLNMLQPDKYWRGVATAIGRADLLTDPHFAEPDAFRSNGPAFAQELQSTYITQPLAHWRKAMATQSGQWDVVQQPTELLDDPQILANRMMQQVTYPNGRTLPMFTSPIHFDRTPPELVRAPEFGEHTDELLPSIGIDDEKMIQAKIDGAVI